MAEEVKIIFHIFVPYCLLSTSTRSLSNFSLPPRDTMQSTKIESNKNKPPNKAHQIPPIAGKKMKQARKKVGVEMRTGRKLSYSKSDMRGKKALVAMHPCSRLVIQE